MIRKTVCPECGGHQTTRQVVMHGHDCIEVVRTCEDCVTEYTLTYELVDKETTYTEVDE